MTSEREKKMIQKLRRRPYRSAYVGEHVRRGIAHQIRALRGDPSRNWTQAELSGRLGKPQSVVSRMEDPSYGKLTVQTLLEVAAVFDVALSVRFVDFPTFIAQTRDLTEASMWVQSFEQSGLAERLTRGEEKIEGGASVLSTVPSYRQFEFNRPRGHVLLAEVEELRGTTELIGAPPRLEALERETPELLGALAARNFKRGSLPYRSIASGISWLRH